MKLPDFVTANVPLASHSTLGVGGLADYFAVITHDQAVPKTLFGLESKVIKAYEFAREKHLDIFILGQGSNVLFSDKGLLKTFGFLVYIDYNAKRLNIPHCSFLKNDTTRLYSKIKE